MQLFIFYFGGETLKCCMPFDSQASHLCHDSLNFHGVWSAILWFPYVLLSHGKYLLLSVQVLILSNQYSVINAVDADMGWKVDRDLCRLRYGREQESWHSTEATSGKSEWLWWTLQTGAGKKSSISRSIAAHPVLETLDLFQKAAEVGGPWWSGHTAQSFSEVPTTPLEAKWAN